MVNLFAVATAVLVSTAHGQAASDNDAVAIDLFANAAATCSAVVGNCANPFITWVCPITCNGTFTAADYLVDQGAILAAQYGVNCTAATAASCGQAAIGLTCPQSCAAEEKTAAKVTSCVLVIGGNATFRDAEGYTCADWAGDCSASDAEARTAEIRSQCPGSCTGACACADSSTYRDSEGYTCADWTGDEDGDGNVDCTAGNDAANAAAGYNVSRMNAIRSNCPGSCSANCQTAAEATAAAASVAAAEAAAAAAAAAAEATAAADSIAAAEAAAAAAADAAAAVQIQATVTYDVDIATIVAGSAARQTFVSGFKSNIAAALNGIDSDDVTINSITAGSVVVDYTITASPSVATAAKTALAALPVADLSFGAVTATAVTAPLVVAKTGPTKSGAITSGVSLLALVVATMMALVQ